MGQSQYKSWETLVLLSTKQNNTDHSGNIEMTVNQYLQNNAPTHRGFLFTS